MSRFIQSLESRRLFSAGPVDKATLVADEALVVADGAAVRADLRSLAAVVRTDTAKIQVDLRGLPKTNLPLMRTLRTDEARLLAQITKDVNALLNPGTAVTRQSTAAGVLLLAKATVGLQARVGADVTALGTVTVAPLATFQADLQGAGIDADLQALVNANPSATTLAADVAQQTTDTDAQATTLSTSASSFATDIGALAADLGSALSNSSLLPTLAGTYSGSARTTSGNHVGRISGLVLDITSEGTDGSLTGSVVLTQSGQSPVTLVLSGSVSVTGAFTATLTDNSGGGNGATLTARVTGTVISGTYASTGSGGTFSVHK